MRYLVRTSRVGARALALLGVLLGTLSGFLLVGVAPANAHNILIRTSPVDGSTVTKLPDIIVLTFNEPGQADGMVMAVTGPSGNVATGPAMLVDSDVRQAVGPGSPPGRYTVDWRVVSADGHPVDGSFTFTATKGTSGTATPRPTDAPTVPAAEAAKSDATGWLIGAIIAIFAIGIGAILLYRRRPAAGDAAEDDED
ncbi:MAG TPA: copper resistance CopC family protein [Actinopolymorphaceae bacterium]